MYTILKRIVLSFCLVLTTSTALADDIDIISAEQTAYDANILFIMDVSGSMAWPLSGGVVSTTNPSRISVLRTAMAELLNDPEMQNINFGLSSFAGDYTSSAWGQTAHGISYPVTPIDGIAENILDRNPLFDHPGTSALPPTTGPDQTTRSYLQTISNTWVPIGGTPIVDALFEGALYFRGLPTNWGRHDPSKVRAAHPSTYVGLLKDTVIATQESQCNSLPCTGSSCNSTKTCEMGQDVETCSTPSCGDVCSDPTTVREACAEGVTSCGTGENCTDDVTQTVIRNCITNSTLLCRIAHPTWYGCGTKTSTTCKNVCAHDDHFHDSDHEKCEGEPIINQCSEVQHKQCKEDIEVTVCDANSYSCTTDTEQCTHEVCEAATINTTVLEGEATFISPIESECPANGIILLSDGAPTVNQSADLVSTMMGDAHHNNCDTGFNSGRCGVELAKYIATNDNSVDVTGKQFVNTFTVGLSLQNESAAEAYLKALAGAGAGEFINASNPGDLVEAFKLAIDGIAGARARTFSAPTYSINTSNLLSHEEEIYVPMFDRKGVVWPGNLKKFTIDNGIIKDKDGNVATNSIGELLSTAKDEWSTAAAVSDDSVRSGGAANKLNPATRSIYTENSSNVIIPITTSLANSLFYSGTYLVDDAEKAKLITYIKGTDPDTNEVRYHMGDMIHSKPIKLNRASGTDTVFIGSNEGYLHAINDDDGTEVYAYMPSELLKNISDQYHKVINAGEHIYGVDGPITLWIDESASSVASNVGNNVLDAGEKAYLFFGLRRGGKHYYALDVTDPTEKPKLIWKDTFGNGGDSWSQPVLGKLKLTKDASATPVLVIGGGYNDNDNKGNSVHIINALTGVEIWKTTDVELQSGVEIEHGIPSKIRVIDIDRNGSIDRLYFGDTGGNIWRVDLNADDFTSVSTTSADNKLYKLASLGGAGADNRRFFEEPDVAIFRQAGVLVATIAIGSGDRTKPLSLSVDDKFYVLYDKQLRDAPTEQTITKTVGLKDAKTIKPEDIGTKEFRGWYRDLGDTTGEKVLASAVTYKNKVFFTTFGTVSVTPDACNPKSITQARFYILDLISGKEYTNVEAAQGEILGKPQIIFEEPKAADGSACTEGNCIREHKVRVGKVGPFAIPNAGPFQNDSVDPVTGFLIPDPNAVDAVMFPRIYWIDNEE